MAHKLEKAHQTKLCLTSQHLKTTLLQQLLNPGSTTQHTLNP